MISARFLSAAERIVIVDLRRAGHTAGQIAIEWARSSSRFNRDLCRNLHVPSGTYRPCHADQLGTVFLTMRRNRSIE